MNFIEKSLTFSFKDTKIEEPTKKKDGDKNANPTSRRNFTAAPKKTLNLAPAAATTTKRDWLKKADDIIKTKLKETKKVRKKRLWLERKENGPQQKIGQKKKRDIGNWEYLPDICLEIIFQYLPFEQKSKVATVCQNWHRNMSYSSVWSDLVVHDTSMTRIRFNFAGKFYEVKYRYPKGVDTGVRVERSEVNLYFLLQLQP